MVSAWVQDTLFCVSYTHIPLMYAFLPLHLCLSTSLMFDGLEFHVWPRTSGFSIITSSLGLSLYKPLSLEKGHMEERKRCCLE